MGFVLGPNPRLQFTLNNGQWNAFGKLKTLDWDTRLPKATYQQPGGIVPYPTDIPLDMVGRTPGFVYWEDTGSYFLLLTDRNGNEVWSSPVPYIPAQAGGGGSVTTGIEIENLFINGQFRFFPVEGYNPIPNAIENLADGGWSFRKDGVNTAASLTFKRFTPDNTTVDASPVYFINYVATSPGSMETFNDIVFSISDVKSLANEQVTVSANWRSGLGGTTDVEVIARQNFGSASPGVIPSGDFDTNIGTFGVTSIATDFTATVTLPSLVGKTIGENGDDKLEIIFRFPLNANANLEFTNAYLKRGAATVGYPYETADEVNATIKALEIPDRAKITDFNEDVGVYAAEQAYNALTLIPDANNTLSLAWLPTIPVGATIDWLTDVAPPGGWIGLEGQQLLKAGEYRRLYDIWGVTFGKPDDNLSVDTNETTSFITVTDLKGAVTQSSANSTSFAIERLTESYNSGISFVSFNMAMDTPEFQNDVNGGYSPVAAAGTSGLTVTVISNGSGSTQASWTIEALPASSLTHSTYFEYDSSEGSFYRFFIIDGIGADPLVPGRTGAAIMLESTNTNVEVAKRISYAVQGKETTRITPTVVGLISPGHSWYFSIVSKDYYNWFTIDGVGTDPMIGVRTGVRTDLLSSYTEAEIVTAIIDSINPLLWLLPDTRGYFPRYWDNGAGRDPNAATREARPDGVSGDKVGTTQQDEFGSHNHESVDGNEFVTQHPGGGGTGGAQPDNGPSQFTANSGGDETRPINFYFYKIAKY